MHYIPLLQLILILEGALNRSGVSSVYRRPQDGAAVPVEAEDGPFIEDPFDELGRG